MFKLGEELQKYKRLCIQPHNNPDVDSLACAYTVYRMCKELGLSCEVVYYGEKITKPNIVGLLNYLEFEPTYNKYVELSEDEVLVTVDCIYGRKNVQYIPAQNVISIDHHLQNMFIDKEPDCNFKLFCDDTKKACSSIIAKMFLDENFTMDRDIGTALYYGILSDTLNFTETLSELDLYCKKYLDDNDFVDKEFINVIKYNNISLKDLQLIQKSLASLVLDPMLKKVAILHVEICDQNILGYISDMILEVDGVDIVVCFFETDLGYRMSIRSSYTDITAYNIINTLTQNIGEGGGHIAKAGGFIEKERLKSTYPKDTITSYINRELFKIIKESNK